MAAPGPAVLPEVLVALVRAHLPTVAGAAYRIRGLVWGRVRGRVRRRPELA